MKYHALRRATLGALVVLFAACAPPTPAIDAGSGASAGASEIDGGKMMADLAFLASDSLQGRLIGSEGGATAAAFIESRFRTLGIEGAFGGAYRQPVIGRGDVVGSNVVARIVGSAYPDSDLLLTAHFDHLGVRGGEIFNGADDNASGTAALLAMAAYFAEHPPRHSIIFAALDGEEGGLRGARALAASPPVPLIGILLNVNMDMVSRDDFGEIWAAGTSHDPWLLPLVEPAVAESPVRVRFGHDTGEGRDNWTNSSDHGVFHQQGMPFLYFGVEDHPDYHRPTDDVELINPTFYADAVRSILGVVRALDGQHAALSAQR